MSETVMNALGLGNRIYTQKIDRQLPKGQIIFRSQAVGIDEQKYDDVARIDENGIMHFAIDATDENAKRFVDCIERFFNVRLTGIEVTEVTEK